MKQVRVVNNCDTLERTPPVLDDFSRFKEKVIMISTLERLLAQTDKKTLKSIIRRRELPVSHQALRQALEEIVMQAIKRVEP